jgi:hypothetical protein
LHGRRQRTDSASPGQKICLRRLGAFSTALLQRLIRPAGKIGEVDEPLDQPPSGTPNRPVPAPGEFRLSEPSRGCTQGYRPRCPGYGAYTTGQEPVRDADQVEVACGAVPKPRADVSPPVDRPWDRKKLTPQERCRRTRAANFVRATLSAARLPPSFVGLRQQRTDECK